MDTICNKGKIYFIFLDIELIFSLQTDTHTDTYTQTCTHCLACPREIKSQLRGRKTNLEGQTKHLSSCVCLVGK